MEKQSFFVSEVYDCTEDWKRMLTVFGCVEEVERVFGIEFACAIEAGQPLFLSDDEALLARYDGCVEEMVFRRADTGKVLDARTALYRFDVCIDDSARGESASRFRGSNIVKQRI